MSVQIFKYWDRVRSSFWFLPSAMVAGAVALSFINVALDEWVMDRWLLALGWTFSGGWEGASPVLTVVARSMITLTGVVFSLTPVALSLASSQLGPSLLRNFMRDTPTQLVLGTSNIRMRWWVQPPRQQDILDVQDIMLEKLPAHCVLKASTCRFRRSRFFSTTRLKTPTATAHANVKVGQRQKRSTASGAYCGRLART